MSFFRGDRTFSPFLRHDPFTPFFPRSSFQSPSPFSRVFDSPFYSPLSPFITVYEEPRNSRYEGGDHPQSTSSQKAVEASPSQSSNSTSHSTPSQSQSKEMTNTSQSNETGMEKRHNGGRRHHRHGRPQQQMSLWSPFTGSLFNSSLINSAFAPLGPFSQAMQAMPEISLDMFSTPQAYSIHASVPGMDKKDIKVTVEDGVLTIQAERKESKRPSQMTSSTSSSSPSSSSSTQGATTQGSSSTTGSQSTSQQSGAEMKYPTEEKEEKGASPTTQDTSSSKTSSSPSGASSTAETTKDSLPLGSNVQASGSSNTTASGGSSNAMDVEDEDDDVNFHHVESFYGRVERSVQLPEDANVDSLTAQYENGILKIDIPRIEQKTKGRRIEIQ